MGGQLRTPKLSLEGGGSALHPQAVTSWRGGPFSDIVSTFAFFLRCGFPKIVRGKQEKLLGSDKLVFKEYERQHSQPVAFIEDQI